MANKNTNPGGGKPQFLQTSTMPNPHISPNLTTLGRGNGDGGPPMQFRATRTLPLPGGSLVASR